MIFRVTKGITAGFQQEIYSPQKSSREKEEIHKVKPKYLPSRHDPKYRGITAHRTPPIPADTHVVENILKIYKNNSGNRNLDV